MDYPSIRQIVPDSDCLCPDCLKEQTQVAIRKYVKEVKSGQRPNDAATFAPETKAMVEGIDYYLIGKLWVMTEWFHLKRGYCCGNRCRHCPYDHVNVPK